MSRTPVLINLLDDNPWQVREVYDPAYLEDLAADILKNGLLQPPLARMNGNGILSYQLAFGHCRLRAYQHLHAQGHPGFDTMPVEVRPLTDEQMADFAWTENEQRRDVTPIERMHAIRKQMETFGWTQKEIAERRGLSEATVSNILRLGQLPEEIQDKVHKGELAERAALPLLTYFSIPQAVRDAAAKKTYVDNPEKFAREGRASDEIRDAVKDVVQHAAIPLNEINFESPFTGPVFLAPTCTACANHFLYGNSHYCGEQTRVCYDAKKNAGRQQLLEEAHRVSGIPLKTADERSTYSFGWGSEFVSLHPTADHPGILAQGCEHLRLQTESYIRPAESLADKKFHSSVKVVCCNPSRDCTCAKAMELARRQARAAQTNDPEALARLKAEEAERTRKANLVAAFKIQLIEPTRQALLEAIQANDVRFWQILLDQQTNTSWEEIAQWDLETCLKTLATHMLPVNEYRIANETDETIERLNRTRTRLGLAPLELPEPENLTPAEKLLRRLERIEGWMERWAEGEEDATPSAVRGNVANLEKIKAEYAALDVSDEDNAFFLRINAHLDYLNTWLVEYDAESDEHDDPFEEDEELALEEAYA